VVRITPPFRRRRTTKKEPRRSPWPAAALEERIEEIMDRVQEATNDRARAYPPWSAVPVRQVTVLTAPNYHSAHGAVVVLDEATLVAVTSATPTRPRLLPAS
jgi:tetrahydromethanopterin S-methyltransferase subunit B